MILSLILLLIILVYLSERYEWNGSYKYRLNEFCKDKCPEETKE